MLINIITIYANTTVKILFNYLKVGNVFILDCCEGVKIYFATFFKKTLRPCDVINDRFLRREIQKTFIKFIHELITANTLLLVQKFTFF